MIRKNNVSKYKELIFGLIAVLLGATTFFNLAYDDYSELQGDMDVHCGFDDVNLKSRNVKVDVNGRSGHYLYTRSCSKLVDFVSNSEKLYFTLDNKEIIGLRNDSGGVYLDSKTSIRTRQFIGVFSLIFGASLIYRNLSSTNKK